MLGGGGDEESTEEGGESWCEVCGELRHLLRHSSEESRDENSVQFVLKEGPDLISKGEIGALYRYLNAWKFGSSLESLIGVGLYLIKSLGGEAKDKEHKEAQGNQNNNSTSDETSSSSSWNPQEIERLLQFLSKDLNTPDFDRQTSHKERIDEMTPQSNDHP
ncbi:ubiquitin carboxyl-terminal hydrolase 34 isoform X3 [Caligus rogercresseyi]|uniref:Ubiquitin carboxyl-terminal hydrolase 34 isoform X3 n=1 Tax=Caligus rogercresseyi TaxID=217165 RepID=A0A7T8KGD2_CALRO|nr:ubiquitin carboxyl-terminal hydrolase 34 isoform X3 [Caligus rogercresseyi]